MIEMLGVLAIIGVLSVGGIMGYSKAMFRYKINKTIDQITYIAGNVRTTFANQGNYRGLSDSNRGELLRKAHIVPDDMPMDVSWGSPIHLWDQRVAIYEIQKNSADILSKKAFQIWYEALPEEVCIELITHDWKNAQVGAINISSYNFIPPAKLDDAVKMCGSQDRVTFNFDIDTSDSYWKDKIDATTAALAGS